MTELDTPIADDYDWGSDRDMWQCMHEKKRALKYSKKNAAEPLFAKSGLQFTEFQNGYKFADRKLVYYPSTGKLHDYGKNLITKMTTKQFLAWMKSGTSNPRVFRQSIVGAKSLPDDTPISFGAHKGKDIKDVPSEYLEWMTDCFNDALWRKRAAKELVLRAMSEIQDSRSVN